MKKSLLYLTLLLSALPFSSKSQIENGDFESWTSFNFSNPGGWDCANKESAQNNIVVVTQVNGQIGNGIRMETKTDGNNILGAYIANGDPFNGEGGIPCSQIPTALTGFYRYNLPVDDSALIIVVFKNSGSIIGSDIFMIKGSGSQNTFAPFSFPISLSQTPDSVIIAATSSNLISNTGVEVGSFLELDEMEFTGAIVPIPNNSFETWNSQTIDYLTGWISNGDVIKTNDSHNGSFAIQLTTQDDGNGNFYPGSISNGQATQMGATGGIPYDRMNDTLIGYYKYFASGNDSASFGINLSNNGAGVGGSGRYMPSASVYTYFEIPISCMSVPDTLRFDISSSKYPVNQSSAGSVLYLDDLQFKSELTLGINRFESGASMPGVYPNPAKDYINIHPLNNFKGDVVVEIFDVAGRMVRKGNYQNRDGDLQINISSFNQGVFYYSVSCENYSHKGLFIKN